MRTKVWVEREDGAVLISDYRAQLLAAVEAHGSVAAAARASRLPYRTAWKKLDEMERAAGARLLASVAGGSRGGQTTLTPAARAILEAYYALANPASTPAAGRVRLSHGRFVSAKPPARPTPKAPRARS